MKYFTTDYLANKSNFESHGLKVFAYSIFNYPLICIHALIEDTTPAPLEKLDRTIVSLLVQDLSVQDIHSVLGLPMRVIKSRVNDLLKSKYLFERANSFQLTSEGEEVFLIGSQQIHRIRTIDIYLDGLNLTPLTKHFYRRRTYQYFKVEKEPSFDIDYKGEVKIDSRFLPDIPHTPPSLDVVSKKVFEISPEKREEYNIPLGLEKIKKISYTKIIYPLLMAHRSDENGNKKNFVFDGYQHIYKDSEDFISFNKGLGEKINNVSVELNLVPNRDDELSCYFNNNWDDIDRYNDEKRLIIASEQDLSKVLGLEYGLSLDPGNIEISTNFIRVVVDYQLFRRSTKKLKVLSNLERGSDYFWPRGTVHCIFFEFYTEEEYLQDLIEINNLLNQHEEAEQIKRILKEFKYSRKQVLVDLERFLALEKIDIQEHFITYNDE